MDVIDRVRALSEEIGPRRPCSPAERRAAEWLKEDLGDNGIDARLEPFRGYPSFGLPFGLISAAGLAAGLVPRRVGRIRAALALSAAGALALEGDLRWPLLSRALSRGASQNVVATIEPIGEARRTVCLIAHIDSSRSGLMFDPRFVRHLGRWITLQSLAGLLQGAEPLIGRRRCGRRIVAGARAVLAAGLALLIEREIRGVDVPGANDNASGVAVIATLAAEFAGRPLDSTRIVFCATGCEESGTLGAQALLESRETRDWLFVNFDNVGGSVPLRFLAKEGVIAKWEADRKLVGIAERLAAADPGLLRREDRPAGLTYDTSPVLARGGRGLTLSAQDGYIPDLHWPTDVLENIDSEALERALSAGRALLAAIDRGEAD